MITCGGIRGLLPVKPANLNKKTQTAFKSAAKLVELFKSIDFTMYAKVKRFVDHCNL